MENAYQRSKIVNKLFSIIIFSLLLPNLSFSQSTQTPELYKSTFTTHFYVDYLKEYCGINIKNFLKDLYDQGTDISEFTVIEIRNTGTSNNSHVNGEASRFTKSGLPEGEVNWIFHVIAIDGDGKIYDFDFMKTPMVMNYPTYFFCQNVFD